MSQSTPVIIINNVLDFQSCANCIHQAERQGWSPSCAEVSGPSTRATTNVRIDVQTLFSAIRGFLPTRKNEMEISHIAQDRVLCVRYQVGEHFPLHTDFPYSPHPLTRSLYTLMVYLNDDFEGGHTSFPNIQLTLSPRRGMALLFPHGVNHRALTVTQGTKYVLHGFVLYQDCSLTFTKAESEMIDAAAWSSTKLVRRAEAIRSRLLKLRGDDSDGIPPSITRGMQADLTTDSSSSDFREWGNWDNSWKNWGNWKDWNNWDSSW